LDNLRDIFGDERGHQMVSSFFLCECASVAGRAIFHI